jgi:SAM-dependent methyltransferase
MVPGWVRKVFPTARRLLVRRGLERLRIPDPGCVLVIGAGNDPYRGLFGRVDLYVRFDIVPRKGMTDVVGDALWLPLRQGAFHCVVASEVLEHVPDPQCFVAEIERVLAPGGFVIITVPFMFHRHADPLDCWRPTADTLFRLFASFAEVTVTAQGNRLHSMSDLLTTAFYPVPVLFPLRLFNHLLVRLPRALTAADRGSTAPSGFMLVARKRNGRARESSP